MIADFRVCKEITDALWRERRGGRWEAPRRRRCRCASSRSGNKADAPAAPRPYGLGSPGTLVLLLAPYIPQRVCALLAPSQRPWGSQQSVSVTSWQTLGSLLPRVFVIPGTGHCHTDLVIATAHSSKNLSFNYLP